MLYKDSRNFQDEANKTQKQKSLVEVNRLPHKSTFYKLKLKLRVISTSIADSKLHNETDWTMIAANDIRENVGIVNFVRYGF